MMIVKRLCYLCWNQEGIESGASHKYKAGDDKWYDVCPEHLKLCKNDGFETEKIKTIQEIEK